MLAVIGWPVAELLDRGLASSLNLPSLLTRTGMSPSLLNGGLSKVNPFYWALCISIAALVEYDAGQVKANSKNYQPGDVGYDFLNLLPSDAAGAKERRTAELKHGRIAMLAVVGYAAQEALYRVPVTEETPFFFHPIGF